MTHDNSWEINTALRKTEKILDVLGKGPVSLDYMKLDEENMKKIFTPFELKYHSLLEGGEIITIRNADGHLLYVVDVTWDSVLTALADLYQVLAKKF